MGCLAGSWQVYSGIFRKFSRKGNSLLVHLLCLSAVLWTSDLETKPYSHICDMLSKSGFCDKIFAYFIICSIYKQCLNFMYYKLCSNDTVHCSVPRVYFLHQINLKLVTDQLQINRISIRFFYHLFIILSLYDSV